MAGRRNAKNNVSVVNGRINELQNPRTAFYPAATYLPSSSHALLRVTRLDLEPEFAAGGRSNSLNSTAQSHVVREIDVLHPERTLSMLAFVIATMTAAQEIHVHRPPERLGTVSFPNSCKPAVQPEFNRGVALLHSFAYTAAGEAFQSVAHQDSRCAIAHWGIAMTYFHQLWDPAISTQSSSAAQREIEQALRLRARTERERQFVRAAALVFQRPASAPYITRLQNYEQAMAVLASQNKNDVEAQIFYALALVASASPADKMHTRQKQAVALLQPLFRSYPQHPGIAHYIIHACDNSEMAPQGLSAAKAYSAIAPSAPHALHMPSHIFTRLGLWEDSISSNVAARDAAHQEGDIAEELHAMDYLVYAYLQGGRDADAAQVIQQARKMPTLNVGDFKIAYAFTAMPIRFLVERQQWSQAAELMPPGPVPPQVAAITVWARGLGLARSVPTGGASEEVDALQAIEAQLHSSGNEYWATQVRIMQLEVMAWSSQAKQMNDRAVALMREAADQEDSIEKQPVTPGPILPAREQLAQLLLQQGHPDSAAKEFKQALTIAPGRRGALHGLAQATEQSHLN